MLYGELASLEEKRLVQAIAQLQWPIQYGSVTITLRDGKPTLVKVETTIKLD